MKGAESLPAVEEIWTMVPGLDTGKEEAAKREKGGEEEEKAEDEDDGGDEEASSQPVSTPASLFSSVLSPLPAPRSGAKACVTQQAPKKLTSICRLISERGWWSKGPGTATPAQLTSPARSAAWLGARCRRRRTGWGGSLPPRMPPLPLPLPLPPPRLRRRRRGREPLPFFLLEEVPPPRRAAMASPWPSPPPLPPPVFLCCCCCCCWCCGCRPFSSPSSSPPSSQPSPLFPSTSASPTNSAAL
jgi:hypothetical protein